MRISIIELREMVAQAVRQTVREAKAPKIPAERSEESVMAQRDRHVRGLPGHAHSTPLDMSKPLGKRSRAKRQGASNIGNWTSESRGGRLMGGLPKRPAAPALPPQAPSTDPKVGPLVHMLIKGGVPRERATELARKIISNGMVDPAQNGLSDPAALGMEGRSRRFRAEAAVRKLVGMIVDEEIRVTGRR